MKYLCGLPSSMRYGDPSGVQVSGDLRAFDPLQTAVRGPFSLFTFRHREAERLHGNISEAGVGHTLHGGGGVDITLTLRRCVCSASNQTF